MTEKANGKRADWDADAPGTPEFKPLNRQEAQTLRAWQPLTSPWRLVAWQVVMGALVALVAWGFSGEASVAASAAYGALVVVVPGALFARGLTSKFASINAATAGFGFFVWEALKIALSIAMMSVIAQVYADLSWLALLAGMVLTMKVYWAALLMRPKQNYKTELACKHCPNE